MAEVDRPPRVMWAISQIAERDGVSRQAVSKAVLGMVEHHELPVERDGRGRISKVSLAHYDHHRGVFANPAKVAAARRAAPASGVERSDSFDEARRQNEWLKVEREKLEQAKERRELVRVDLMAEALDRVGREIQAIVARLPNQADALSHASAKEGTQGVRVMLRTVAFDVSRSIADALASLEVEAPQADPAMVEEEG